MSNPEDNYCRLCAEPTPKEQLITSEEDVAVSSKIATKMLWINIDIINATALPSSICFSCFDSLERTWAFLHNVRTAQEKLNSIFLPKQNLQNADSCCDIKLKDVNKAGKPVDKDWDEFLDTKMEVKMDPEENLLVIRSTEPNSIMDGDMPLIKSEEDSEEDFKDIDSDFNTTDSDLPLRSALKKKKTKRKKRAKYDSEILEADLLKIDEEAIPLDVPSFSASWDDHMCRCANCDAQCKNIAALRLHSLQIHSSCCIFKCSDCGKVVGNFKAFVNHVRTHKKLLRYCCEYCNKQFTLPVYVKKHINTAHRDESIHTCQICGAKFDSPELLQDHLINYAKGCRRTRRCEKLDSALKCEHCDKEFKSRSNLQQHKLVHTERSRDFSCHVCGKMFFTKGTLSTHMSTHEDTKPFKCEYCPMAFRARGNLQSHKSLHSGSKPFVCEQCGKSFRVKRHLKSHSIVHTDLMPYVCEYCNKPFRFKTRLNLHLRQHTGAKPYNCIYCQRDFTNGSNFKKHMKRRHNIDTSKQRYNNIVPNQSTDGSDVINNGN